MNLLDVLQDSPKASHDDVHYYSINGIIKQDNENDFIRVYPNPLNASSYFLIKKVDVIGEVYKWTTEELVNFGFIGENFYRLKAKAGTKVQFVQVRLETLGETIDGNILFRGADSKADKEKCRRASGCGHYPCCNELEDGRCRCSLCCDA